MRFARSAGSKGPFHGLNDDSTAICGQKLFRPMTPRRIIAMEEVCAKCRKIAEK